MPGWLWQEPWPITALYCAVTRNKYQPLEPISGLCSVNESLYQFVCFECNRKTFWLNHIVVVVVLKAFPSQAFSLICFPGGKQKYPNDPNGKRSLCQIKLSVQLEKPKKCIKNVSRDLLRIVFFLFLFFIAQLCCGCASRTHLTDVWLLTLYPETSLSWLLNGFVTSEGDGITRWRQIKVTAGRMSAVGQFPVMWLRSPLQKKKNPICGEICLKLGAIIQFRTECDSLWIKQLLHCNGRAALKNPCVCSQNEMAHFPQRKSQDHCHW